MKRISLFILLAFMAVWLGIGLSSVTLAAPSPFPATLFSATGPVPPPQEVPNLADWYDPSAVGGITDTGTLTLTDFSGGGRNCIQATAANKPAFGARFINSLTVLDYDGTNDFMDCLAPPSIAAGPNTLFLIVKSDATGDSFMIAGHNGGSAVWGFRQTNFGTQWAAMNQATLAGTNIETTTQHLLVMRRNGTLLELWVDGTPYSRNDASNVNLPNNLTLGRENAAGGRNYFNGLMGEWFGYNRALTNAEINYLAGTYLQPKWNTPAWTPVAANDNGHRFANDNRKPDDDKYRVYADNIVSLPRKTGTR